MVTWALTRPTPFSSSSQSAAVPGTLSPGSSAAEVPKVPTYCHVLFPR